MHTCRAPVEALQRWLSAQDSKNGTYGHLLLEQADDCPDLVEQLRPYFESAHLDARTYFHAQIGIDLHPDAEDGEGRVCYPACLPSTSRRGLFGEVMAGLVTESYEFIGGHKWSIPVFLFRYHDDAERYLFDLARDTTRERQVFGRFGSDFLGVCIGEDGSVVRFIIGEAKWRTRLQASVVEELLLGEWITVNGRRVRSGKGIWFELNRDTPVPHGVRQLQRLLQDHDPDGYAAAIVSIDRALMVRGTKRIPRTDLVLIAGNDVPSRPSNQSLLPRDRPPTQYRAGNDLQVVELVVKRGEDLIDALYTSLWAEEQNAST